MHIQPHFYFNFHRDLLSCQIYVSFTNDPWWAVKIQFLSHCCLLKRSARKRVQLSFFPKCCLFFLIGNFRKFPVNFEGSNIFYHLALPTEIEFNCPFSHWMALNDSVWVLATQVQSETQKTRRWNRKVLCTSVTPCKIGQILVWLPKPL